MLSSPTPTNLGTTGITTLNPLQDFNYLQKGDRFAYPLSFAEVNALSSPLLQRKSKKATLGKTSTSVRPSSRRGLSRVEFCERTWAACIKRIYEIDPLECPKCKGQMRIIAFIIIAFIQDAHSIKEIMKSQGIPDFQAPPPIPKFITAQEAMLRQSSPQNHELPSHDSSEPPVVSNVEPAPDDF